VVVAVVVVRVMQAPVDEIVDVVSVRHGLVTAVRSVDVAGLVTIGRLGVIGLVGCVDGDHVLIDMVLVRMMQVAVVQVVGVTVMVDGGVAAVRSVNVIVAGVGGVLVRAHGATVRRQVRRSKRLRMRRVLAEEIPPSISSPFGAPT
jgi:hypothetical protein